MIEKIDSVNFNELPLVYVAVMKNKRHSKSGEDETI